MKMYPWFRFRRMRPKFCSLELGNYAHRIILSQTTRLQFTMSAPLFLRDGMGIPRHDFPSKKRNKMWLRIKRWWFEFRLGV